MSSSGKRRRTGLLTTLRILDGADEWEASGFSQPRARAPRARSASGRRAECGASTRASPQVRAVRGLALAACTYAWRQIVHGTFVALPAAQASTCGMMPSNHRCAQDQQRGSGPSPPSTGGTDVVPATPEDDPSAGLQQPNAWGQQRLPPQPQGHQRSTPAAPHATHSAPPGPTAPTTPPPLTRRCAPMQATATIPARCAATTSMN